MVHSIIMQVLQTIPTKSPKHFLAGKTKRQFARPRNRTKYTYDDSGRLVEVYENSNLTATYVHNALGQRVTKTVGTSDSIYVYDIKGTLLAEHDASGNLVRDYVWLDGAPIAQIDQGEAFRYLHFDHLGTPRHATDDSENLVWSWESDAFGLATADEDPDGDTTLTTINLRFPGQYFDSETGFHYNYFRTFDPRSGRYLESDPIGLNGGLNTYGYAAGNPLTVFDPLGLDCVSANGATHCTYPGGGVDFKLPTPPGFPSSIGYRGFWDINYHRYDVKVPLNGADEACVMQKLIENPTPGTPKAATPSGASNNATVLGQENNVLSYLTTDLKTGGQVVVNMTIPGSLFSDGYVARTIRNGVAHTYGEGTNAKQSSVLMSLVGATGVSPPDMLWGEQMRKFVEQCSCEQ